MIQTRKSSDNNRKRKWIFGAIFLSAGLVLAVISSLLVFRQQSDAPSMTESSSSSLSSSFDHDTLTLSVGRGIGPVSFGAARNEVIAAFGSPSVSKQKNGFETMEYPSLGFWLLCHEKKGVLQFTAFNSLRARVINGEASFNGKTKSGIGIGSSKEDIEKNFGEPIEGFEADSWNYKSPKVSFEFQDDEVAAIGMTWDGKKR